jgi:sialate O-acetylesterase
MIAPVQPFAIRGVIWYQGESNAAQASLYRRLFPNMIRGWRETWGEGDFPFLFVQIANYGNAPEQPAESAWAELREAQALALSVTNTGMATAMDIGDAKNIHPHNKRDVGFRLALVARAKVYGKEIVSSGPVYDSMKIEGGRIRISFRNAKGLAARNKTSQGNLLDGEPAPQGFAIAGADQKWAWASAKLDGKGVVVWNDQIPNPVAVRYAWADNPVVNLYNEEGLPAFPFRTDDWKLSTAGKAGIPEFD